MNQKAALFLDDLERFQYQLSGYDRTWDIIFADTEGKARWLKIIRYRETHYLLHVDGKSCNLEITPEGEVLPSEELSFAPGRSIYTDPGPEWLPLFDGMIRWLRKASKDWIRAAREIRELYPLERRTGILSNSLVRASLTDIYRLDREIGESAAASFCELVEKGFFRRDENTTVKSMTGLDFFHYCKIAYIAGKRPEDTLDESLSGREMYKRFADGRHEGLLDIDENSPEDFAAWIDGTHPKKTTGGHPWEIKRGGNTTHIDLYVMRPQYGKTGYQLMLRAPALSRLAEALRMVLAIHDEGLPITIDDAEGIRKRLLGQDNIGIIPEYQSLHRAHQQFEKNQNVYDVMYYSDLGRYKHRLTPFITWKPLPLLVPH